MTASAAEVTTRVADRTIAADRTQRIGKGSHDGRASTTILQHVRRAAAAVKPAADPDSPETLGEAGAQTPTIALGTGRGTLDRRVILLAAVTLIDEQGLRYLTMRASGPTSASKRWPCTTTCTAARISLTASSN